MSIWCQMKTKIIGNLLLFSVVVLLFNSCTEDIAINLSSVAPELVVEGVITNEVKAHQIVLKKTGSYFMNEKAQMVSGAEVMISDGTSQMKLHEDPIQIGHYYTSSTFSGIAGYDYTLSITNVDVDNDGVKESYESKTRLTSVASCDSITVVKQRPFYHDMWAVKFTLQDPPVVRNNYLFRIYKNDICVSDSIIEWGITSDEFFNGVNMINESVMYFDSRNKDEKLTDKDKITLEVCGISEEYLRFINEVRLEFRGRNPLFGGQPANIRTNIVRTFPKNSDGKGVRGFFAAYSVSWASKIYRE